MDYSKLNGSTIMVTGATGLIGKNIIETLLRWNRESDSKIQIIAIVRNKEKAKKIFGNGQNGIVYVVGDIKTVDLGKYEPDYIIHAASQTSSRAFVDHPVETISVAFDGTRNLLEYARKHEVKRFLYLSTMEVYGTPQTDEKIDEEHFNNLDTMKVRTCYPESKRMCENLCVSYAAEYHIPINVLRLTQTFGPGVEYNDGRVFAEFARCSIEEHDIILKTKGETKRCYLHVDDAVEAVLAVMVCDVAGEVYNVANEDSYCSIYEMANFVANDISQGKIKVKIEEDDGNISGYAPTFRMNLDTSKLRQLGWIPKRGLNEMFTDMIEYMKQ